MIITWDALIEYVGTYRTQVERWIAYEGFPRPAYHIVDGRRKACWNKTEVDSWLKDMTTKKLMNKYDVDEGWPK